MNKQISAISQYITRFIRGHGFSLLTTLCVCIITTTALFTRRNLSPQQNSATPPAGNRPAAVLWQQSLPASTPTPLPTVLPILWRSPLPELHVARAFSSDEMVRSGVTGMMSAHLAVDLSADVGTPVVAIASGRVLETGMQQINGTWITIEHTGGYISCYASLSLLGALKPGDPISAGQTVGFVGNTYMEETDLGPHLHLSVTKDGAPVDPMDLLQ